jgi:hypothetical protein
MLFDVEAATAIGQLTTDFPRISTIVIASVARSYLAIASSTDQAIHAARVRLSDAIVTH